MCPNRIEILQEIQEEALTVCPRCGMDVTRVVSRASIKISKDVNPDKAAKRGFSTFKKVGKGTWEKVAGPEGEDKPKGDRVLNANDLEDSE